MKKIFLFVVMSMFAVAASAQYADYNNNKPQEKDKKQKNFIEDTFRPKYRNLSYVSHDFSFDGVPSLVLDKGMGGAFTSGRTYKLHRKPILGMIRFGIDATWADFNYVNYKYKASAGDSGKQPQIHDMSYAMGVGPSLHVNPIGSLWVNGYFRYVPTLAVVLDKHEEGGIYLGYGSYFVAGGAVSWRVISLGAEARWGGGKLTTLKYDADKSDIHAKKVGIHTNGVRAYVSFRF